MWSTDPALLIALIGGRAAINTESCRSNLGHSMLLSKLKVSDWKVYANWFSPSELILAFQIAGNVFQEVLICLALCGSCAFTPDYGLRSLIEVRML